MPVPPQIQLTDRLDATDLFMVRPLSGRRDADEDDEVFYWHADHF